MELMHFMITEISLFHFFGSVDLQAP